MSPVLWVLLGGSLGILEGSREYPGGILGVPRRVPRRIPQQEPPGHVGLVIPVTHLTASGRPVSW
jgi:hypothetical protein